MPTIFIDNIPYEVQEGQNLLSACLSLGFNIPYFCWHPALHSVGSCRMCAVKHFRDENDTRGHIVMSCMTPADDGVRISIDDKDVREFRAGVIEWLMINHPHDCPVCDEGGECHLQDMTVMSGHVYRRYGFKKRTYQNQNLGPFIHHEMNRCIQCYRCVRFYRDYAGGRDFNVFGINNRIYFGRFSDGALENEFSGNLVEVCPTGVFTDKTLRKHYTRKWDLQTAPSVCPHCGLGCNIIIGERYGSLRRVLNKYSYEVNGYFICDRGRFGYEFVNGQSRIRQPLYRQSRDTDNDSAKPVYKHEAIDRLKRIMTSSARTLGIGSPRASLEANFSLRELVGAQNFYSGMSENEDILVSEVINILCNGPVQSPSLREVENCDTVLILGEDVTNVAPRLALSLRQAARQASMKIAERLKIPLWADTAVRQAVQSEKGPVYIASPIASGLDDISAKTFRAAPDNISRLGFQIAHEIDPEAPEVAGLSEELYQFATLVANDLKRSSRPLIVSGTSCAALSVIQAAANIAWALTKTGKTAGLSYTLPECNTLGMGLLRGRRMRDCFQEVLSNQADCLIILENDLFRRAEAMLVQDVLAKCQHVVIIDHTATRTTKKADLVLPAGSFSETTGTLISSEGRCQRQYSVMQPAEPVQESYRWVSDVMKALGRGSADHYEDVDAICSKIASEFPILKNITEAFPARDFRAQGQKIPRQPHRYSGRTAMQANISVHEPKPPDDPETPLSFSMEGYPGIPPTPVTPRFWAPSWNSCQAVNKYQREVSGPLIGGDSGKRLIEASNRSETDYFREFPETVKFDQTERIVVQSFHIFGSEELSSLSDSISQRISHPYIGLNIDDAEYLGKTDGDIAKLSIGNTVLELPVKIMPTLCKGLTVLPIGIPGMETVSLPAIGKFMED